MLAVAAAVYLNAFGHEFTFDDAQIIRDNIRIRSLGDVPQLFTTNYWGDIADRGLYRPLTLLTYALNYAVSGLDTWSYTAVNIGLHATVSTLVVLVARSLGAPSSASTCAGLLFAVHPVHAEAVGLIVGRADLLATGLFLAGILVHRSSASASSPWRHHLGAAACFGAGLLCKESAATWLPVVVVLDWFCPPQAARPGARRLSAYGCYGLVLAGVLATRWLVLGAWAVPLSTLTPVDNPIVPLRESALGNVYGATPLEARLTALAVLTDYARLLVWPARLSADYSFAQIPVVRSAGNPAVWGGVLLLAGVLGGALGLRRRIPWVAAGFAILALTFSITSNLPFPIGTICGERLLYLPSAGFALAAAGLFHALPRRPALVAVTCAVALGATRTWLRNPDLRTSLAFWESTAAASPGSTKAQAGLGGELAKRAVALDRQRRHGEASPLYDRALHHLRLALEIYPESAYALNEVGNIQLVRGTLADARANYRRAATLNPQLPVTWANWAFALKLAAQSGDATAASEALAKVNRAIELRPNHAPNYELRADVYESLLGDEARAATDRATARKLRGR